MNISNCCGVKPRSDGDGSTEDYGICPECHDHCEYEPFIPENRLMTELELGALDTLITATNKICREFGYGMPTNELKILNRFIENVYGRE